MTTLAPLPKMQFFDADGQPLNAGKLYTYAAGTTTPLATYTDSTGGTPNANPVILNSRGEASVWLSTGPYKFVLKDSNDATIYTVDNVTSLADLEASLASSTGSSLVGFLQSGTGAQTRTVESKLRDVVSVKDFGAVGDGVTDDTAAIQTAIDFAGSLVTAEGALESDGEGVTVFFPGRSNYKITSGITLTNAHNGISIDGMGSTLLRTSSTGSSAYALSIIGTDDYANAANFISVKSLRIQSESAQSHGIYMQNAQYCSLVDIRVDRFKVGVKFSGSYGVYLSTNCWSNVLKNITVNRCFNGFFIGEKANTNVLIACRAEFSQQYSMQCYRNSNTTFFGCQFEFSGLQDAPGNPIMDSADADLTYSVYIRSHHTSLYSCRFDGNVGRIRIHGESGNTFWDYSVGTKIVEAWFTPNDPNINSYAIEIDRAKNTEISNCKAYKWKDSPRYSSAFVRLAADSKYTALRNNSLRSQDPDNPSDDLTALSIVAGASNYVVEDFDVYQYINELRSATDKVLDLYGERTVVGGSAIRMYSKNSSGVNKIRVNLSGQQDDALLSIENQTVLKIGGVWNDGPFRLGNYFLWVDATGDLRIKNGAPASDGDGTVVGTQT